MSTRVFGFGLSLCVACASVLLMASCVSRGRERAVGDTWRSELEHFASESLFPVETPAGLGAGFWIDGRTALTAAHAIGSVGGGEVEVLRFSVEGEEVVLGVVRRGSGQPPEEDWAVLEIVDRSGPASSVGEIGFVEGAVARGARVVVAGARDPRIGPVGGEVYGEGADADRMWYVVCEVVEPPRDRPSVDDRFVWLRWPLVIAANGLSGGPAVLLDDDGSMGGIVGVVIEQDYTGEGGAGERFLIVRRVTEGMVEDARRMR